MTYVDTSALGKLLILEAETIALQASLQELPDRLASSELTIAELSRAVLRARGSAESAGALLAQLDRLALDRATLDLPVGSRRRPALGCEPPTPSIWPRRWTLARCTS